MPKSVLSRGRKFVARLTALAMVASIMVIGAAPAGAAIDTSTTCPSSIESAGFVDIGGFDATTQTAINCLVAFEISQGTSANTYSPAGEVSRWQMALFLTRQAEVHGLTLPSGADQGFNDIGSLNVSTQVAINQLAQLDITEGTSATTFSPNDVVTRWQMALFITRLVEAAGITLPSGADQGFNDIGGLTVETQTAINQLAQLDIADGTSATTYSPLASTLRWQMALFLTRTLAADGIPAPTTQAPAANVDAPQLVSVTEVNDTVIRFTFDEDITGKALAAGFDGIRLYDAAGAASNPANASIQNGNTILAEFDSTEVDTAALATVQYDTVEDASGTGNIEGSQPLTPDAIATPDFPGQLIDVDNYVVVPLGGGDEEIRVDFTFDDADVNPFGDDIHTLDDAGLGTGDGEAEEFFVVGFDGTTYQGVDIVDSDVDAGEDTVTVTISLAAGAVGVPESEFRRGIVTVNDGVTDDVLLAHQYEGTSQETDQADLVSVERTGGDTYVFTFDEAVSNVAGELNFAHFYVADADGTTFAATEVTRSNTNTSVVTAEITDGGTDLPDSGAGTPVVAFVDGPGPDGAAADGAVTDVQGGETGPNNPDEVVLTLPAPVNLEAGETDLPDLEEVIRDQNVVSEDFSISFVFDDDIDEEDAAVNFDLFDANGVLFRVTITPTADCGDPGIICSADGTTITFDIDEGFTDLDNEDIAAGRVGAVQQDTGVALADTGVTEGSVTVDNA